MDFAEKKGLLVVYVYHLGGLESTQESIVAVGSWDLVKGDHDR